MSPLSWHRSCLCWWSPSGKPRQVTNQSWTQWTSPRSSNHPPLKIIHIKNTKKINITKVLKSSTPEKYTRQKHQKDEHHHSLKLWLKFPFLLLNCICYQILIILLITQLQSVWMQLYVIYCQWTKYTHT